MTSTIVMFCIHHNVKQVFEKTCFHGLFSFCEHRTAIQEKKLKFYPKSNYCFPSLSFWAKHIEFTFILFLKKLTNWILQKKKLTCQHCISLYHLTPPLLFQIIILEKFWKCFHVVHPYQKTGILHMIEVLRLSSSRKDWWNNIVVKQTCPSDWTSFCFLYFLTCKIGNHLRAYFWELKTVRF